MVLAVEITSTKQALRMLLFQLFSCLLFRNELDLEVMLLLLLIEDFLLPKLRHKYITTTTTKTKPPQKQ